MVRVEKNRQHRQKKGKMMKSKDKKPRTAPHKLGDDRNEIAVKPRKIKSAFKESRDVREDRGTRQSKMGHRK
ncbi:MAG TPA: hypothetical protein DF383_05225 [Deltaproteobacteria bacterium]|nr:hypothetical protein [Deltaproteobacteria bacterium]